MQRFSAITMLALVLFGCSDEPSGTPSPTVDENGITTKGLVARYTFDNGVNDLSGNGLNGTPTAEVAFIEGRSTKAGRAAQFNGMRGQITITGANIAKLEPKDALTISFWIKGTAPSGADQWTHIITKANAFSDGYVVKWTHDGAPFLDAFLISGASGISTPNDRIQYPNDSLIGDWHHVAYVWSRSIGRFQLFIDGEKRQEVEATVYDGTHSSDTLYIGGYAYRDAFSRLVRATIPASLDDVRIYERALDSAEIVTLSRENL